MKPYRCLPLRRQIFDRVHNVRDLGGYATPNGMTAWGRVFRSGRLFDPTEQDLKRLKALCIHTVIDLRTDYEIADHPDVKLEGVHHQQVDFLDFLNNVYQPMALAEMYEAILMKATGSIRRALELVAQGLEGGQAVLFHCAVGKDRTGILAALLLLLCGVDRTDIIADYQTSRTYLEAFLHEEFPEGTDLNLPGYQSLPGTISSLLDLVEQRGGVRGYLAEIGLSDTVMDKLVLQLTIPIPSQED